MAQYVTIPDPAFASWLQTNTFCIHFGNQLDTTCSEVLNDTVLSPSGVPIHDLTGIGYFKNLTQLTCSLDSLARLPTLPPLLWFLDCHSNQLTSLPALPTGITYLTCYGNQLSSLPSLPPDLYAFAVSGNLFTSLPALPATIQFFYCSDNQLTTLPALPPVLKVLYCDQNILTAIPPFPATLWFAQCRYNLITYIPPLPNASQIDFSSNMVTSMGDFPDSLVALDISNNTGLTCLPQLNKIAGLNFENTGITCLPNYGQVTNSTPAFDTVPLCSIFNVNGCSVYWNINGTVYYDANNDCTFDANDAVTMNAKIKLYNNGNLVQQVYSGGNGNYALQAASGAYAVTVDTANLPFTLSCPPSGYLNDTVTVSDSMLYNQNLGLKCRTNGFDVGVQSLVRYGAPRPGNVVTIKAVAGDMSYLYGAHCAAGISGQVQLTYSGSVSYIGPATGSLTPSQITGNTLTWNIADFGTVNGFSAFNSVFQIGVNAQEGDTVCLTMTVTPTTGDYNPANNILNYCFPVLNSLDPNEKEVYPAQITAPGQWLTYTIGFQNTGNAPAINIQITDTLDANLDPATFQLLAYSAKNLTQVFGNAVVFNFPNINLPDSLTSDSLSRGYVQYRVKTLTRLTPPQTVSNTASVYFDSNPAIVTNTVIDTVVKALCAVSYDTIPAHTCSNQPYPFNGNNYNVAGSYNDTLTNSGGCDSIVTLVLTVNQAPVVTFTLDSLSAAGDFYYSGSDEWCGNSGGPQSFILKGGNPAGGVYSGYGIYSNIFYGDSAFIDTLSYYNDIIRYSYTDLNGCSANVSDTILLNWICEGIQQITANNAITIYPNPATDQLFIKTENIQPQTITIYDVDGRMIFTQPFKPEIEINQLSSGVYFIEVQSNEGVARKRFVKM
jgi:uncharacterized repeat protein (TIGR01451 family)